MYAADKKHIGSENEIKPMAAGCIIKSTDRYYIAVSIACFGAFIVFGSCHASLGASVPMISQVLHESEASIGFAFITRGSGFLVGTIGSGLMYSCLPKSFPKDVLICILTVFIGVITACVGYNSNYYRFLMLTVFQGFCFGVVDTFGNCLLPELWGVRVQPWMQALHLFYGVGAIFGPLLIGYMGFQMTYHAIGLISALPLISMVIFRMLMHAPQSQVDYKALTTADEESSQASTEIEVSEEDELGDDDEATRVPVTIPLRVLIAIFYFIYGGTESSFGGWISVYAMNSGATSDPSTAAYIATLFWLSLTIGRIVAVFTAIYFSATFMLRFHLTMTIIASILLLLIGHLSVTSCYLVSASMGLAVSAVYPLAMTIVTDYGYTM